MTPKHKIPSWQTWALALSLATLSTGTAFAQTNSPIIQEPVGGGGDRDGPPMICPNSHPLMVGVHGRVGDWVDQIGILCARLKLGWVTGEVIKHGGYRGGNGGAEHPAKACHPNAGIRTLDIGVAYNNGKAQYVTSIYFNCHKPASGELTNREGWGAAWFRDPFDDRKTFFQVCPGNTYATGLSVRWGRHVNALGLICDTLQPPKPSPSYEEDGGIAPPPRRPFEEDGGIARPPQGQTPPGQPPLGQVPPGATFEVNIDRPGGDYNRFQINDPQVCRAVCFGDPNCKAWTFVRPPTHGPLPWCYLKSPAPQPQQNPCCISGTTGR